MQPYPTFRIDQQSHTLTGSLRVSHMHIPKHMQVIRERNFHSQFLVKKRPSPRISTPIYPYPSSFIPGPSSASLLLILHRGHIRLREAYAYHIYASQDTSKYSNIVISASILRKKNDQVRESHPYSTSIQTSPLLNPPPPRPPHPPRRSSPPPHPASPPHPPPPPHGAR